MSDKPIDKAEALKAWLKHKKAETTAGKKRVATEKELISIYGLAFKEQSKTFREEDLGFSINLKKNETVKFNQEKYSGIRKAIPEQLRPDTEKVIYKLDEKGMEYLKENYPDIYILISGCIERKHAKTSVEVKKI